MSTKKKALPVKLILKEDKNTMVLLSGINKNLKTLNKIDLQEKLHTTIREGVVKYNAEKDVKKKADMYYAILDFFDPSERLKHKLDGRFEVTSDGKMFLEGTEERIPSYLSNRIKKHLEDGLPVEALVKYWKRLILNPDENVKDQLFPFMEHSDIAITEEGYIYAVKAVKLLGGFDKDTGKRTVSYSEENGTKQAIPITSDSKFAPHHSGGDYGNNIELGKAVEMPREKCDSNPNRTCSAGLMCSPLAA